MVTESAAQATDRNVSLDTLRAILVAWIIGGHALLGYSSVGGWAYDEVQEVTFHQDVELVLAAIMGPSALFLMGSFFLIAGLFAPHALDRKGPAVFAKERSLRLGLPFVASALVIWPLSIWLAYRSTGRSVSYGFLLTGRTRLIDSGGLWFAEVLLVFSLAYALWRVLARAPELTRPATGDRPVTGPEMLTLAIAITLVTAISRRWMSARGTQYLDLHLWQWPQLAGMFVLGIVAARRGLAVRVPERLGRVSGWATLGLVLSAPLVAVLFGIDDLGGDVSPFLSGWTKQALLLAAYEGFLVVFGSLWLLRLAQRKLRRETVFRTKMARSSFAAFILQGPVLIVLAVAMRPLPLPAEVKAPVLGAAAIAGCFFLGWLLVTRTRVGRIV